MLLWFRFLKRVIFLGSGKWKYSKLYLPLFDFAILESSRYIKVFPPLVFATVLFFFRFLIWSARKSYDMRGGNPLYFWTTHFLCTFWISHFLLVCLCISVSAKWILGHLPDLFPRIFLFFTIFLGFSCLFI